jgi:crotonobetainyl-CoA:carnitine CoA-transferase CaiB-like acyl-CoA transferase
MGIKLSAKFARQESEEARLARIARKRIPTDRIETIRRMLGLPSLSARRSRRTRGQTASRARGDGG